MIAPRNKLLTALQAQDADKLTAVVERGSAQRGTVLAEPGEDLSHVHFPDDCVLSLLSVLADGTHVETATIGHEGAFGALASFGRPISSTRCMVQVEGQFSRVPLQWLRLALQQNATLQEVFARYVQATVFQIQQSAACNASHAVEKRLARWLLEMSDRGDTSRLALTHEFLAGMLGANRATISVAAAALQDAGCISYRRGCVAILDRARLQSACCECYASVREHEAILDAR